MLSLATGQLRQTLLSLMLGIFVFGFLTSVTVLITPSTAQAQEDEQAPALKESKKTNPIAHFFKAMFHDAISMTVSFLIIAISVGMVALIIILLLDLRLGDAISPAFVEEFTDMVNKRQFKQAFELCRAETSFLGRVLTAGMGRLQYGIEDAREAMAATTDSVRSSKDAWISYLGIVGTLGPLLGLVGTVSGMIGAFRTIGAAEGPPDATALAAEISTALVLTLLGVGLAVPAIFWFSFFRNRLTGITVSVANLADDLLTQMYHNSKKAAAPSTAVTERAATK